MEVGVHGETLQHDVCTAQQPGHRRSRRQIVPTVRQLQVVPAETNSGRRPVVCCMFTQPGCSASAASAAAAGQLVLCEPTMAAREEAAAKVAAEVGATFIPPYDYGPVIAGQGTIGLELLQQVRDLEICTPHTTQQFFQHRRM